MGVDISITLTPWILGDVNHDGIVNGLDIADVASHWLQVGSGVEGDANGDGVVNGLDISLIASHWLQSAGGALGTLPVPEPSTLLLGALAITCLSAAQVRRKAGRGG